MVVVVQQDSSASPQTEQTTQQPGGVQRTRLIEMANVRTEKRGKVLDLEAEFLVALQEFCTEQRWWWRKKSVAFNTVAGEPLYDLGSNSAIDCEQICKGGVKLVHSASSIAQLTPIYDTDEQDAACEDTAQGEPGQYFIERGTSQVIRFVKTPGGIYRMRVSYWAVPNVTPDSQGDTIPLVPGYLHHIVEKKLEAQIFRFTLGEGSAKYTAAQNEYMAAVAKASEKRDYEDGRVREWVDTNCNDSVRSTR